MKSEDCQTIINEEETEYPSKDNEDVKGKWKKEKFRVGLIVALVIGILLVSLSGQTNDQICIITGIYVIYFSIFTAIIEHKRWLYSGQNGGCVKSTTMPSFKPIHRVWTMIIVDIVFIIIYMIFVFPAGLVFSALLLVKVLHIFPFGGKVNALAVKVEELSDTRKEGVRERVPAVLRDQVMWILHKLESKEKIMKIMQERKMRNCILVLIGQLLCLSAVVGSFCLMRESIDEHTFTVIRFESALGFYGPMENSQLNSIIMLVLMVLIMAGIIYSTIISTVLVAIISLGAGIFQALLSTWSVQAFSALQKTDDSTLVLRGLQLLPIPFIAIILLGLGFQTAYVFIRQEECTWKPWKIVSTVFTYVSLLVASASLVAIQVWTMAGLQQNWNSSVIYHTYWGESHLKYVVMNCYVLQPSLFVGLACSLAVLMVFNLIAGNLKVPGLLTWFCSAFMLIRVYFISVALLSQHECKPIFSENLSMYMLVLGLTTMVIASIISINGIFLYLPSIFWLLIIIARIIFIPVLAALCLYVLYLELSLRLVAGETAAEEAPKGDATIAENNNKVKDGVDETVETRNAEENKNISSVYIIQP